MAGSSERRQELARFLRNRRARITPEQVGLPAGARRRTQGLRREEVAVLAGLSPTWYTYLEQGRDIHPSPQVLDSLANVLCLEEDERKYIHLLALDRTSVEISSELDDESRHLVTQVTRIAGYGPFPVYAANQYGELLAWNKSTTDWYTDFGLLPEGRRNMLWWMLTDPEAKKRIIGWAEDTRDVVARLRAAYAGRAADRKMNQLVRDLERESADFRVWWSEQHVREQHVRPRTLTVPGLGTCTFRIAVLRVMDSPFHSVVVHLPIEGAPNSLV
ncbi:transcriptional regulator [Sphaerisporangium krabiense]|uniref:Transcriptional regulator with XRE-family HTH domain n=1 Tax=Sphaerisporangium krabiense TaxID=763782 RepID=A0A7W9DQ12_9ACTN|nr:helix-turn-helix transcriptional regulator [Sphaerisporangium krabiense]MBB5626933.1 transcriptional regulator with XRE-family HTH domain [Sphaerisporangium krabiense]GII66733.1 transcriptional regulator [Sphaerisporangium krabiense]